jgi:hypothetical protein
LYKGTESKFKYHNKVLTGDFLVKVGIPMFASDPSPAMSSRVIEITEVK